MVEKEHKKFDDLSEEELQRISLRWRSDMEAKMDTLLVFVEKYEGVLALLMERETNRAAFQRAVIEKTMSTLIVTGVAAILALLWSGARSEYQDFMDTFRKK